MAKQKTIPTGIRVEDFLNGLENDQMKKDCFILRKILTDLTGAEPRMWGNGIVGFGSYHYKYESGHEGDTCLVGLSPKKDKITLYLAPGFCDEFGEQVKQMGKVKTGKGCLYIGKLEDVSLPALKSVIKSSIRLIEQRFPIAR